MDTQKQPRCISTLLVELDEATKSYQECVNINAEASRNKTIALNELNKVQKEFDEATRLIKSQAPRDTDWSHDEGFSKSVQKMAAKS